MSEAESRLPANRNISVSGFSVIKEARLNLNGIRVIIGPQASGKSLICKLSFFFQDIFYLAAEALTNEVSLDDFKEQIKDGFYSWFPVASWGTKKFRICFDFGTFNASIIRTTSSKNVRSNIRLHLCKDFCETYIRALSAVQKRSEDRETDSSEEQSWRTNDLAREAIREFLGKEVTYGQAYIPAGRAFFTTYGKAIAAFESGSLDRVTYRFGKRIETLFSERNYVPTKDRDAATAFESIQRRVLKGKLLFRGQRPSFETEDGRVITLPNLSSGTQEALPLIAALRNALGAWRGVITFIEEPEAHLFPDAQKDVVELISLLANHHQNRSAWIITTHSPYVLSAFNNLIEAGSLGGSSPSLREKISAIIPNHLWISKGQFEAFTFEDGILKSITSPENGLVSSNYLDKVSETLGAEFDELLRLGHGKS